VLSICCIEDEPQIRELLQLILGEECKLLPAASAKEAIEHLVHEPSLFLIDLHLPGMNGLELTKLIRTIFPTVPIIILTALSREKYEDKAIEMGATTFLEKPFNPGQLRELVGRLLPRRSFTN
jgi:two-component system cell cycle response regulator DivK